MTHKFIVSAIQRQIHSVINSLNLRYVVTDALIRWCITSLVRVCEFTESLLHGTIASSSHWFIGSFGQLRIKSIHVRSLAFEPKFVYSLMRPTVSKFIASAPQRLSSRPLISYFYFIFRNLPPQHGPGIIWWHLVYAGTCWKMLVLNKHRWMDGISLVRKWPSCHSGFAANHSNLFAWSPN